MTAKQASRNAIAILVGVRMILVASLQNEASLVAVSVRGRLPAEVPEPSRSPL